MIFNIGNKIIEVEKKDNEYSFPELVKVNKNGKINFWRIIVNDKGQIFRWNGIEGGKVREFEILQVKIKNQGKKNETSLLEQALIEGNSKWKRKQDGGYAPRDATKETEKELPLPMLALDYNKRKKSLKFPCGISPKLDGKRCLAMWKGNEIILFTRGRKVLPFLEHIKKDIASILPKNMIFDGELYNHEKKFSLISSLTSKTKKRDPNEKDVQYWIFDLIVENDGEYANRMEKLREIQRKTKYLRFVYYDEIEEKDIQKKASEFIKQGYEGAMLRNLNSVYFHYRTANLLKYKEFEDDEFKIVGYEEGTGSHQGAIIFICLDHTTGKTFKVLPSETMEEKQEMYKNSDSYIGKMYTVKFFGREKDRPRFPTGKAIREEK